MRKIGKNVGKLWRASPGRYWHRRSCRRRIRADSSMEDINLHFTGDLMP
ncbi:MAG: hypothetical protein ACLTK0_00845 [Anaerovoracaceae bacterium]